MNHYELDLYLEVVYFCRNKRDRKSVFKIHELVAWFVLNGQTGGTSRKVTSCFVSISMGFCVLSGDSFFVGRGSTGRRA